ncbi:hypothetical protein SCUCBS95973_003660 [Sporothrix curviconia]|uniref:Beta-glucuronidase C-terminal domain-containing protein n=1 Tax=Sporothrix curviconia TaxID=1260050 RepID=A0ABP0BH95_9PEZI
MKLTGLAHGLASLAMVAATQCVAAAAATSVNVPAATTKPANAVAAPGDFVGFGFEMAFLNDYANDFSVNLMNAVGSRVSLPLTVRLGGTSNDLLTYDASQTAVKVCVSGDCPIGSAASYILGPSFFDGFDIFTNFSFSVQAPLSPTLNISNAVNYVRLCLDHVPTDRLTAIAIGNEPDLYAGQFKVTYNVSDYVAGVTTMRSSLTEELGLTGQIFELMDIAYLADSTNTAKITIQNAFNLGVNAPRTATAAAVHWYQVWDKITTLDDMQAYLMNHSATVGNFSAGSPQDIAYLAANYPKVKYVFSETGTGLVSPLQIQGSLGAALFYADFQLYAMTQGAKRVDGTMRPAANHSLWVPDASAAPANPGPQVRAPFYTLPFVADFIGQTPGNVIEVALNSDVLTAYASYSPSTGLLSKVALINLQAWAEGVSTGARGSVTFSVPAPSAATVSATVRRLTAAAGCQALGYDYAGPAQNITWAGEQWSYAIDNGKGHMVAGVSATETVAVVNGAVQVTVLDSEAVIVSF